MSYMLLMNDIDITHHLNIFNFKHYTNITSIGWFKNQKEPHFADTYLDGNLNESTI